uniref:Uncharacterized protein n=1 Tax=Cuerna arida TaxID=1464854 RepID=A0A1B6G3W5_9HEMI
MPRSTKLCKKRCFRGNQHNKNKPQDISVHSSSDSDSESSESRTDVAAKPTPPSASRRKLVGVSEGDEINYSSIYNNVIVSLDIITQALLNATCCKQCKSENTLGLLEESDERQGLACKLSIVCSHC